METTTKVNELLNFLKTTNSGLTDRIFNMSNSNQNDKNEKARIKREIADLEKVKKSNHKLIKYLTIYMLNE